MEKLVLIQSKLKAPKSQFNSFGKYKYRKCEDILEALKPLLKECKCALTITDDIVSIDGRFYVKATATLIDCESKESISTEGCAREEESRKGMDSSQITGASSSYARKYALNGLFCIDDNQDPDTQDNTEKKEAVAEKDSRTIIYEEVLATMKKKFANVEQKKAWFTNKGIKTAVKDMDVDSLSSLLDILNDASVL